MARLRLDQLSKVFPGKKDPVVAVDRLSLSLAEGELLVLLGPSGCGKTTTLRLIGGLLPPSSGTIELDGTRIESLPAEQRPISIAFQAPALFPQLTVADNVELGLRLRRVPKAERTKRVEENLHRFEISDLRGRYPEQLSGGQQQRISLARALAISPRVFLLDEPLSSLDPGARLQIRAVIRQIQRQTGTPMIYVTHDQAEAVALADRLAIMQQGQIEQTGTPAEIYHSPASLFVAQFIGTPPMNLFRGALRQDDEHLRCDLPVPGLSFRVESSASLPERNVIVGIRPEHVRLCEIGGVEARIMASTPVFPECHLQLRSGDQEFTARVPSGSFKPNATVRVAFAVDQAHFFDPETGLRLPLA